MQKIFHNFLGILTLTLSTLTVNAMTPGRGQFFDTSWSFHRGKLEGAEKIDYNDEKWRKLDLPHDYSNEDVQKAFPDHKPKSGEIFEGPTSTELSGGQQKTGYAVGGEAWYRKHFNVPEDLKGKQFIIEFSAIYMNSDIWINGEHLGNHPHGFTPFYYNITDKLKFGKDNVIAVRVKNIGKNCRWYSGSGIYRHVKLDILNPIHFAKWGTFITTPEVSTDSATVKIENKVENSSDSEKSVAVVITLIDKSGKVLTTSSSTNSIKSGENKEVTQEIKVANPELWSPKNPYLYTMKQELLLGDKIIDQKTTTFGIRKIEFSAKKGFLLNNKPFLLKGGCMHGDNGCLGSIGIDRADERRVELMKKNGFNAIRCAHNPPTVAFLNACDRLGMLVIDEAFDQWRVGKTDLDYHLYFDKWWKKDLESMILRDRNHPSIIMWSIGNEIKDIRKAPGAKLSHEVADYARTLDSSRPITMGVNRIKMGKTLDPAFSSLDVCGYNYGLSRYEADHERVPDRIIFGSESYIHQAYDNWEKVKTLPYVIGDFVWAAFDYRGEVGIGWQFEHKWTGAYMGDIDLLGDPMPSMSLRDIVWNPETPAIAMFVEPPEPSFKCGKPTSKWAFKTDLRKSWNFEGSEGKTLKVMVFSSCPKVGLTLNGKDLGIKELKKEDKYTMEWQVPYESGTLTAIGYNKDGKKIVESVLKTVGKPEGLKLSPDRDQLTAATNDLSFIKVDVVDKDGNRCPDAINSINFKIEGPGEIIAVGSADPSSHESNISTSRKAFQGRCMVVVKAGKEPGDIKLTATSDGLKSSTVILNSDAAAK